jgi:hypothetical protein
MEKEKSLNILKKCLNKLKSMSQNEFDEMVKSKGLDIENAEKEKEYK